MGVPYREFTSPLFGVIAEYTPPDDSLPDDLYVPALPPVGTEVTVRPTDVERDDSRDRTFVVTRIELSFASPAQPFYTLHLTAKQVVDAEV
jgi:hypothetical protein